MVVRWGQGKFKTKDHGALAGLFYKIKKGVTVTKKTDQNVEIFLDVVEKIAENPETQWVLDGTYQAGTDREIDSINLYTEEKNRVIIFRRSTGEFVTFCEPTKDELEDLKTITNIYSIKII